MCKVVLALVVAGIAASAMGSSVSADDRAAGSYAYKYSAQPWTIDPKYLEQQVTYTTAEKPGTIVVDTQSKFLYLVEAYGKALRYGIGVGRQGFAWTGTEKIASKVEWPGWHPPKEMRQRNWFLPAYWKGGGNNPLGARALYLGNSLYRIHGTPEPWTIGLSVSSGCIRMTNESVIDLYNRVSVGTKVVVK